MINSDKQRTLFGNRVSGCGWNRTNKSVLFTANARNSSVIHSQPDKLIGGSTPMLLTLIAYHLVFKSFKELLQRYNNFKTLSSVFFAVL